MEKNQETNDQVKIDFLSYVSSLGFQAMIFLGEIESPVTKKKETNLLQAKFIIDTLVMLRDKTKGNLEPQEDNLLNVSIYELQMKYVDQTAPKTEIT
ncbi:MAG: DUF1844 domain-containing protein [Candidatus Omnitrophica bacterium]|nr:DUF1844 domain-containing protein [Candidatus Omnitrophota bacterium]